MKTYCVKDRRKTESVPGTERIVTTSNGRNMMESKCIECGNRKTQFISRQTGGAIDYACGTNLRGKRAGNQRECLKSGQIRRYGLNLVDPDIAAEIEAKLRPKRQSMSRAKQKEYIDEIVADIKKETRARRALGEPDWRQDDLWRELLRRSADQARRYALLTTPKRSIKWQENLVDEEIIPKIGYKSVSERKKKIKKINSELLKLIRKMVNELPMNQSTEFYNYLIVNSNGEYYLVDIEGLSNEEIRRFNFKDPETFIDYSGNPMTKNKIVGVLHKLFKNV